MAWQEVSKMMSKLQFVELALRSELPFSELCKRFNISRPTGYKLIKRYKEEGKSGLADRSRRPKTSPKRTNASIEEQIIELRQKHPCWGGRTLRHLLLAQGQKEIPSSSAITDILRRHGLLSPNRSKSNEALSRFEHEAPNDLWQVDFKGHVPLKEKGRCHPLTVLDDHSRYSIGLKACADECRETIQPHFIKLFEQYGLPFRINFDNGAPWGSAHQRVYRYTEFSTWLIRLGIRVSFSRPHHPQTNGKVERFHRTLKEELLQFYTFWDLNEAQIKLDAWKEVYNYERPHQALDMKTPSSRYKVSPRAYPATLPEIVYPDSDHIVRVDAAGNIRFNKKKLFITESLKGQPVAIRQTAIEKIYEVYFCKQKLIELDFNII